MMVSTGNKVLSTGNGDPWLILGNKEWGRRGHERH